MVETAHLFTDHFAGYMPHGHCYLWQPPLVWTHAISDFLIGVAYLSISFSLYALVKKVRLPFSPLVIAFGMFIAACGATHFLEVWTLWNSNYWLSGFVKVVTATASVITGVGLVRLKPRIVLAAQAAKEADRHRHILQKQTEELALINQRLEEEVLEHKRNQQTLQSFFSTAPLMMGIVELTDDDILHISDNARVHAFFGRSDEEMSSQLASQMGLPRATVDEWRRYYMQSEQSRRPVRFEYWHGEGESAQFLQTIVNFIGRFESDRPRFSYIVEDRTEAKRSEEKLRQAYDELERRVEERTQDLMESREQAKRSEERLSLALDASDMGIFEWHFATGRLMWTEGLMKLWNYDESEFDFSMENFWSRVHPEDIQHVEQAISRTIEGLQDYSVEYRVVWPDRSIHWVFAKGRIIKNELGQTDRMLGCALEITHIKETEQEVVSQSARLRENENRLALAVQVARLGTFEWGVNYGFHSWNTRIEEILGYSSGEFRGNTTSFLRRVHPNDRSRVFEAVKQSLMVQNESGTECRLLWPDGSLRWISARWLFLALPDSIRLVGTILDITDEKLAELKIRASEEQFRSVFNLAGAGMVQAEPRTGRFTSVNQKYCEITGYSKSELLNMSIIDLTPPEDVEQVQADLSPFLQGREQIYQAEKRYLRKDKRIIWVGVDATLVRDPHGSPLRTVAVVRDITESRQAAQELERQVAARTTELRAANRELEAFSYSVSHDLRAPLRGMDGFSRILLDQYSANLDAKAIDYLQRIRNASVRMGQLIDDLLNLSRLSRTEVHRESVSLSELAQKIASELTANDPERSAQFVIQENLFARGDRGMLGQMLFNLLENAWKYSKHVPQAEIEFSSEIRNGIPVFFVKDNGVGFNMEFSNKLFGAFQRLHTAQEFEGSGIGLAIVKRVLERHGGSIWAESQPGEGSTFYFTIGVRSEEHEATQNPISGGQSGRRSTHTVGN